MDREDSQATVRYDTSEIADHHFAPAFLEVVSGPGQGQRVRVAVGSLVIGRANDCGLCIKHGSVSRRHAELKRVGNGFYLSDLNSHNGTFLNRSRVPAGKELEVNPGDLLHIGAAQLSLRVEEPTKALSEPGVGLSDPSVPPAPELPPPEAPAPEGKTPVALAVAAGALGMLGLVAVAAVGWDRLSRADVPPVVAAPAAQPPKVEPPAAPPSPAPAPAPAAATAPKPPSAAPAASPPEEDEEPPPDNPRSAALELYKEEGDIAGAVALAGKTSELGRTLLELQSVHDAAITAKGEGKLAVAVNLFAKALSLDAQISGSVGVFADEIRQDLSELHTALGLDALAAQDKGAARKAFAKAVELDPSNRSARAELAKLDESGGKGAAKVLDQKKKAIDEAFDE